MHKILIFRLNKDNIDFYITISSVVISIGNCHIYNYRIKLNSKIFDG